MTLKLPLSQDVETAMAKLKAHEEERETGRWLDPQVGLGENFCHFVLLS